jgi:glycosyltransferase involved in cell wall biosynthesis
MPADVSRKQNRSQRQLTKDYMLIKDSGLFDERYYIDAYPDVAELELDPLLHFLTSGAAEGRNPSPVFHTAFYRYNHPDVLSSGQNPLAHYVRHGRAERRLAVGPSLSPDQQSDYVLINDSGWFDREFYLKRNPDVAQRGLDPLLHYIISGALEGRDPGPGFNTAFYCYNYPDVAASGENPLAHYLRFGRAERRIPLGPPLTPDQQNDYKLIDASGLFDRAFYLSQYSDVAEQGFDPLLHFIIFGGSEGRNPNAEFDTTFYRYNYPDVRASEENPLAHYLRFGRAEQRRISGPTPTADQQREYMLIEESGCVDRAFYLKHNPDVVESRLDPILHFVVSGALERRNPSPFFDTLWFIQHTPGADGDSNPLCYFVQQREPVGDPSPLFSATRYRALYSDVAQGGMHPLAHFMKYGRSEGRTAPTDPGLVLATGLFDAAYYSSENPDVAEGNFDPVLHYCDYGAAEGRRPSPLFDAARYLEQNPDLADAGINPLLHWVFYRSGRHLGALNDISENRHLLELCNPRRAENPREWAVEGFRVSIITPTFNTDRSLLQELAQSILNQTYTGWEWVIVDDGSWHQDNIRTLHELQNRDPRICIWFLTENGGISVASNTALNRATGDFVALVDHDDLLAREALGEIFHAWQEAPNSDLFYTDECKLEADQLTSPMLKPGYSPSLIESTMYIGHLSVYRRAFVEDLGGFRKAYDGTQDYDLALRAFRASRNIKHVPKLCYFWRVVAGSTSGDISAKGDVFKRQKAALEDYARESRLRIAVSPGFSPGYWRFMFEPPEQSLLVSVVIPTAGGRRIIRGEDRDLVTNSILSLRQTSFFRNFEIIVVHNGDLSPEQVAALDDLRVALVEYRTENFNLSEKINLGAHHATGDILCLMNDDIEALVDSGGDQLCSILLSRTNVGVVAPLCLYENGTTQHNGVVLLEAGPSHYGIGKPPSYGGIGSVLRCRREVLAVSGAMMVVRKSDFIAVGGYREELPLNYNDVDFCLKLRLRGMSSVVEPDVAVFHYESTTKAGTFQCEKETFFSYYPSLRDPYFNPELDQRSPYFETKYRVLPEEINFENWLDRRIAKRITRYRVDRGPKLTVGVPIFNQPPIYLEEMLRSLRHQTYQDFEVVIVDDASTNAGTLAWLDNIRRRDDIRLVRHNSNQGIAGANRSIRREMSGEYLLLLDADDFLTIDALQVMAYWINREPGRRLFYSDEYKSNPHSQKFSPYFKPDFDPIMILNNCYPTHLMTSHRSLLDEIDAYSDDNAAWCHDYDTLLRALAVGEEPLHVREILYAWRINPGSTASAETGSKPQTLVSQQYVLDRFLRARGLAGRVSVAANALETQPGMWQIESSAVLPDVLSATTLSNRVQRNCLEVLLAKAAATDAAWVAFTLSDDPATLCKLSAPAFIDQRVAAVCGILLSQDGSRIEWSGGFFTEKTIFDPYVGQPFNEGYHGQLKCQRCVDVPGGGDLLVRSDVLRKVADQLEDQSTLDEFLVRLALFIHQNSLLCVVTPHVQSLQPTSSRLQVPLDRTSLIPRGGAMPASRWYNPELSDVAAYRIEIGSRAASEERSH